MKQREARTGAIHADGWWKRGDVKAKPSPWPMSCWVHAMAGGERCRQIIEEAMYSEAKKDECRVALNGEEHDFWMGTEAGMLGCTTFKVWYWEATGQMRRVEWVQGSAAYIGAI